MNSNVKILLEVLGRYSLGTILILTSTEFFGDRLIGNEIFLLGGLLIMVWMNLPFFEMVKNKEASQ